MTEPRKVALSLLITIALFAVFAVASFAGLFDLVEARFYNPSVAAAMSGELSHETASVEVFMTTVERWFSDCLAEPAVQRTFMANQTSADIYERSQIFTRLHERLDGLQWVRFIDAGGNRIHYSTWRGDLVSSDAATAVYRTYAEAAFYTPAENLLPLPGEDRRIRFDAPGERVVFSFYDAGGPSRGLAVFSLSMSAIQNRLIADRGAMPGKLWISSEPPGLLRGVPEDGTDVMLEAVAENWRQSGIGKNVSVSAVESGGNRTRLALFSARTAQGIYLGSLVNENLFVFPLSLKILLLALFFVSMFLALFLLANVRQDPMAVVQSRLKRLQAGLIREYYEQKTDRELEQWGVELMRRREEIRRELRHGLKAKIGRKLDEDINAYIDMSWNDLLAVIGGRLQRTVNEDEMHRSLNRLTNTLSSLREGGAFGQPGAGPQNAGTGPDKAELPGEIELVEEMVPFIEETEEFPAAEKPSPPLLDESEEMVPFTGDIGDLHEESFGAGGVGGAESGNAALSEAAAAGESSNELSGTDRDEAEGMTPFLPGIKAGRRERTDEPGAAEAGTREDPGIDDEEEIEYAEEVEELPGADDEGEGREPPSPDISRDRLDEIARAVEWSQTADEADEPLALEIEVSSPFSVQYGNEKADFVEKNVFDDDDAIPLEDAPVPGAAPLLHTPFSRTPPQTAVREQSGLVRKAAIINEALKMPADTDERIIHEQNGVAYIQEAALRPTADDEEGLDPRMKGLVDSVLKQPR
ncbi:MAG: hypothetical protein LBL31_06130 [Spirochaetaceae bacterium]|jgi:hypothetical protein|nr:hypothetical protein [Spirochaetaceae bacterium]